MSKNVLNEYRFSVFLPLERQKINIKCLSTLSSFYSLINILQDTNVQNQFPFAAAACFNRIANEDGGQAFFKKG